MSILSTDELRELVEQPEGICISIYMPTVQAGTEVQQNPIRFKNLVKAAENQLVDQYGVRHLDAGDLLKSAFDLDQENFWQHQTAGLAIFVSQGFFRYYQLPMTVNELVVVGDRFHLKPLLPLLAGDDDFYILALNQQQVRFFEATPHQIREVEVAGMPTSLEEALQYDETAKAGQFRISTNKGGTNNSFQHAGSFHGQGSPDRDQHQKDILQFFHLVNDALIEALRNKRGPLVLAGVEYLMPLYQEANTYPHLLATGIHPENTQIVEAEELHRLARPLVEPLFAQSEQAAVERYQEMTTTGKTSTDPREAIPAAFYGRVEQLFVPVGLHQWGSFDPQANQLQIHPDAEPGDQDLLDAAAIQTLLNGGRVFAVEPDKVPDAAPLAAVFRY